MQYSERWQRLHDLLDKYRVLWDFLPFHWRDNYYQHHAEAIFSAMQTLNTEQWAELQNPQILARFLSPFIAEAQTLLSLTQFPKQKKSSIVLPAKVFAGVSSRKLEQIAPLVSAFSGKQQRAIEWCAGKGHLGKALALQGLQVESVEWQKSLCENGAKQAKQAQLPQLFIQTDVLNDTLPNLFTADKAAFALHACGDLHQKLLIQGAKTPLAAMYIVPCCYHLTQDAHYQPLSAIGQTANFRLTKNQLKMLVQSTATAGARERKQAQQQALWRLAFDELQRDVRAVDEYLPLPNIPAKVLQQDFSAFLTWAFAKKQLGTAPTITSDALLARANVRLQNTRHMECIQHFFQRPLEVLLLLDKALYLQAYGYQVELMTLFESPISPRNLLIKAHYK